MSTTDHSPRILVPTSLIHTNVAVLRAIAQLSTSCQDIAHTFVAEQKTCEAVVNSCPQVIVALATLQSSVQELSRAYIHHANTVLAPGKVGALNADLTNVLTDSGLLTGQAAVALPAIENPEEGGKKKRKRQPHDPNAPKRALTPYFLYMQHARAQIHKELGDQARPKEVADEGTRRWSEMNASEKSVSHGFSYVYKQVLMLNTGLGRQISEEPCRLPRQNCCL